MVFYTDTLSLIPWHCNRYFLKNVPLMTIWYVVICGWKILSEFHLYDVLTLWSLCLSKQAISNSIRHCENDLRAQTHTHTQTSMPETHKQICDTSFTLFPRGREDLSEQHIQFIHAIRINISNIVPGKIPDDFQYQAPFSADMRFVSSPSGRTSVHSSFRNLASCVEPGASLSSHRRYEKDRHINLPAVLPESRRNMQKERERVFSSSMSRSLLCFLISNRVHCPAVLLSLCVKKENEFVYESVSGCFSLAVNEHVWVYVCICLFCHATVCVYF